MTKNNADSAIRANNDRDYIISLLIGCLETLSGELALHVDREPETLITKALLGQAFKVQREGISKCYALLESEYPWLLGEIDTFTF